MVGSSVRGSGGVIGGSSVRGRGRGAEYRWVKGSRRRRTRMREGSLRDICRCESVMSKDYQD